MNTSSREICYLIMGMLLGVIAIGMMSARQVTRNDTSAPTASVVVSNGVPTLSSCGVGASLDANAIDGWGTINVGTGVVTSCTLTFSKTMPSAPSCLLGTSSTAVNIGWLPSTTQIAISLSLSLASGKIYYFCPI